jgi:hypothetical protein
MVTLLDAVHVFVMLLIIVMLCRIQELKLRPFFLQTDRGSKAGAFRYVPGNLLQGSNALYSHGLMLFMCACMFRKNALIADTSLLG